MRVFTLLIAFATILSTGLSHAAVLHVDGARPSSGSGEGWGEAIRTIGEALAQASPGDEVWVKAGTYAENLSMGTGIALRGGFSGSEATPEERDLEANVTVLDGGDSGGPIVQVTGVQGVVLDGISFQNGHADYGGAIAIVDSGHARILRSQFVNNIAMRYGSNIYVRGGTAEIRECSFRLDRMGGEIGDGVYIEDAQATISACMWEPDVYNGGLWFAANSSGSVTGCLLNGYGFDHSALRITNAESVDIAGCRFVGPEPFDGSLFIPMLRAYASSATVTDCFFSQCGAELFRGDTTVTNTLFEGATNGAMLARDNAVVMLDRCTFSENGPAAPLYITESASVAASACLFAHNWHEGSGGAVYSDSGVAGFVNCVFDSNAAIRVLGSFGYYKGNGGAVHTNGEQAFAFLNCTFVGNRSDRGGAALSAMAGTMTVRNSILWDVDEPEFVNLSAASFEVSYSDVKGGCPGQGNIDADPLLPDGLGVQYLPLSESPCVDAAVSAGVPETDYAGRPRIVNIPGIGFEGAGAVDMGALERQEGDGNVQVPLCPLPIALALLAAGVARTRAAHRKGRTS